MENYQCTLLTSAPQDSSNSKTVLLQYKDENHELLIYQAMAKIDDQKYFYETKSMQIIIECKSQTIRQQVIKNLNIHCLNKSPYIMSYISYPEKSQLTYSCRIFAQSHKQRLSDFIRARHYQCTGKFINYVLKQTLEAYLYLLYLHTKITNDSKLLCYCFDLKNLYISVDYRIKLGLPGIKMSMDSVPLVEKNNQGYVVNNKISQQIVSVIDEIYLPHIQSDYTKIHDSMQQEKKTGKKNTILQQITRIKKLLSYFPKEPEDILLEDPSQWKSQQFQKSKKYWAQVKEQFMFICLFTKQQLKKEMIYGLMKYQERQNIHQFQFLLKTYSGKLGEQFQKVI